MCTSTRQVVVLTAGARNSKDELEMNMRLLGARTIADVVPEMVDTSSIHAHVVAVPGDRLYEANCESSCPESTRSSVSAHALIRGIRVR